MLGASFLLGSNCVSNSSLSSETLHLSSMFCTHVSSFLFNLDVTTSFSLKKCSLISMTSWHPFLQNFSSFLPTLLPSFHTLVLFKDRTGQAIPGQAPCELGSYFCTVAPEPLTGWPFFSLASSSCSQHVDSCSACIPLFLCV